MKRKPVLGVKEAVDALQHRVNDATDVLRECVKESNDPYMALWESNQFLAGVRNSVAESMLPPYDEESKPIPKPAFNIAGSSPCEPHEWFSWGHRGSRSTHSFAAAQRTENYRLKKSGRTKTEFAGDIGMTPPTYLSFRKTGWISTSKLAFIAEKLGMAYEDLVKSG
jgi:hypothetical protein